MGNAGLYHLHYAVHHSVGHLPVCHHLGARECLAHLHSDRAAAAQHGGFLGWVRLKKRDFRKALTAKATAVNEHFSGRGVNFVIKHADGGRTHRLEKVVIEVAARNGMQSAPVMAAPQYTQQPPMYAPQQYVVVEKLPAGAVPLQNMAPTPEYYPSDLDNEKAGLLRK